MYEIGNSPFLFHDHLLTDLARIYSNEYGEPFFVAVGDHEEYDIISQSGRKYEVKYETSPIRTKNVAIEVYNTSYNEPSGVYATQADIWVHIILEEDGLHAYEFEINKLKELVGEKGVNKDSGRYSICRIIPVEEFRKHAMRTYKLELPFLIALKKNHDKKVMSNPCNITKNPAVRTDTATSIRKGILL